MWWACAFAIEPPPVRTPTEQVRYASTVLSDDLRVVVVHHPRWKTVSIGTVIEGGLSREPRAGLTHVLVDTWMSSGGERPVAEIYERLGASSEVRVEPESTVFWVHGPVESTRPLLSLERQRLANPLHAVRAAARPTRETMAHGFNRRYLSTVYAGLYPEGHPYRGMWRSKEPVTLEDTVDLALASWTPERTTLVVAGPMEPESVFCVLERSRCNEHVEDHVVSVPLALPDVETDPLPDLPERTFARMGPVSAGVMQSVTLVGWSLPGLDAGAGQQGRFAEDWVEGRLRSEVAPSSRCHLKEGRRNNTIVCVLPPDVEVRTIERLARKGWRERGLGERVERWRVSTLAELVGASGDARTVPKMAEAVHHTGELRPHAGDLASLAFDEAAMKGFLREVMSEERMVVVLLEP